MTGYVESLIERRRGARSITAVGRAVGVTQLPRTIRGCASSGEPPKWSLMTALADVLEVELLEVVAAFAADADVSLIGDLRPDQLRLARVVEPLDLRTVEDLAHTLDLLVRREELHRRADGAQNVSRPPDPGGLVRRPC